MGSEEKDYVVQVRIKNARLRRALVVAGFSSATELARTAGVHPSSVSAYMTLTKAPMTQAGDFRDDIVAIAHALGRVPEDLFPPRHLSEALKCSGAEREVSFDEVQAIANPCPPGPQVEYDDLQRVVHEALKTLKEVDAYAVREYYGVDGGAGNVTLDELGLALGGVTRERARQRLIRGEGALRRAIVNQLGVREELTEAEAEYVFRRGSLYHRADLDTGTAQAVARKVGGVL